MFFINKKLFSWQNLYDTGIGHYRAGRYLEAITYLLKANKKNPNNPEILSCYGDCCLKQGLKLESYGNGDASLPFKKNAIVLILHKKIIIFKLQETIISLKK
jgi:tetratricopeptide (TPR) repeat protein